MARTSKRMVAPLLALLFLFAGVGDALGAHHCPHHDGTPATRTADSATAHEHHGGTDADSPGPCTCMGRCHAGMAPSLAAAPFARPLPLLPTPLASRLPQPLLRPVIVPFSLPWGNAPPTL